VSAQNLRYAVVLGDGAEVEAVLYRGDTLCVSSQVGCAVGCPFCASGANGLRRQLTARELCAQVELVRARPEGAALARVTVSGVGEPLHNLDAVAEFVHAMRAQRLAPSLTTSGGSAERLLRALALPHNGLTLSVHAGTDAVRARLVPRAPTLDVLFDTLTAALPSLSRSRRRKLALAYLLVAGENDADDELDAFVARALPLAQPVHLYAVNAVPTSTAAPVSRARYEAVYRRLREAGLVVRMSSTARVEANGGCGTLVALRARTVTSVGADGMICGSIYTSGRPIRLG
jgi:23S rRNA (adenine2503-C2)-methyltransferase